MKIRQLQRGEISFQQPVNEQSLRLQLQQMLPSEDILEAIELEAGMFNNTFRVMTAVNQYIFKVAPVKAADVFYNEQYLMQRERSISKQLQSLSPLIPEYLAYCTVDERDAFLQPLIQGRLWYDVISTLSETENATLWQQLGVFAKKLHSCSGELFGYPMPFKGFGKWSEFIADNVKGMVEDCYRLDIVNDEISTYVQLLPRFSKILDQVTQPKLQHGDLWPRNIIIGGEGESIHIKAVFDAERAFWGDPISDWVLILYDLPESFWQGYGENLLKTTDPARIAVYKGMYFILNILEAKRFRESDAEPRHSLSKINAELENYLDKTK